MKETLKKISDVFKLIFGYGIMIVLFSFIPVIIYASTILILFGLLTMYLAGEKALTPGKKNIEHEGEK